MIRPSIQARGIVLGVVALIVMGCARGAEFTAPEQAGAVRSGVYPKFSVKPKAATEQFSEEERQKLTDRLDKEARSLKSVPGPSANSSSNLAKAKEDARREAEETLRQIEQGGNQN
ncbi:hypothetical protein [Bartonella sp. LJL80]